MGAIQYDINDVAGCTIQPGKQLITIKTLERKINARDAGVPGERSEWIRTGASVKYCNRVVNSDYSIDNFYSNTFEMTVKDQTLKEETLRMMIEMMFFNYRNSLSDVSLTAYRKKDTGGSMNNETVGGILHKIDKSVQYLGSKGLSFYAPFTYILKEK